MSRVKEAPTPPKSWAFMQRPLVLVVLAVALVLVLGIGGLVIRTQLIAQVYVSEARVYTASILKTLDASSASIQTTGSESMDTTKQLSDHITSLMSTLEKSQASRPQLTATFVTPFLVSDYRHAQNVEQELIVTTAALRQEVHDLQVYMAYNQQMSTLLGKLSPKGSLNANDLAAQEAAWNDVAKQLQTIQPYQELKEAHAKIIELCQAGAPQWKKLADAYNAKDTKAYDQQKSELSKHMGALKDQSETFLSVADKHAKAYAAAYQRLQGAYSATAPR